MGFTAASLDRIREADIVQVVGAHVQLKKKGTHYFGLSPFKDEKSPSFSVNPVKNNFVDYSTGKSGDGIKFLMELGLTFIEAVKEIASTCGVYLEEEELSPEQTERREQRITLKNYAGLVAKGYMAKYRELPQDHWIKQEIAKRQWNDNTVTEFMLGYAPNGNVISKSAAQKAQLTEAKTIGVVKTKDGAAYDFFRDRLMFPIQDSNGNVVAYGGRQNPDKDATIKSKYMNSPETELYIKTRVLYGHFQARSAMARTSQAILTEGYADVISMHQAGLPQTVASCGTALTTQQAKLLCRNVQEVILCRDGDQAGINATVKDLKILLPLGKAIYVVMLPDGDDPDTLSRKRDDLPELFEKSKEEALIWYANKLAAEAQGDVSKHGAAIQLMIDLLALVSNEITRDAYTKLVSKIFNVASPTLRKQVKGVVAAVAAERKAAAEANSGDDKYLVPTLPEGCSSKDFLINGFVPHHNAYLVSDRSNAIVKATNFTMEPLFHVHGRENNRRLVEILNEENHKRIVDLESSDFVQFTRMKERLINEGFFVFTHDCTAQHFMRISNKILNDFILAEELRVLGWQKKKFFAFADGVYHNDEFVRVNKYGIVEIDTPDSEKSEYQGELRHYYSPAFSEIYKRAAEDDDPYENDRYFVYKESPVNFGTWAAQMKKVYNTKSHLGIAFAIATCFRDLTLSRFSYFPHVFLTGEKGSGKSKFGDSIVNLFFHKLPPFDLNSGTIVGFSRRLARTRNAPAFMEEFNDAIDDRMFQTLKGAFDGRGREKGMATNDNRTSVTHVNGSLVIAGQYHSSRDDNSLTSRSIIMNFIKSTEPFTADQVEEYDKLKQWEEKGLSSLILEIIQHRPYMEKNYHRVMVENQRRFKKDLQDRDYQERMLGNYNALFTPVQMLADQLNLPFSVDEFYKECRDGIIDDSDLLVESEGLSAFWNVLEKLAEKSMIKENDQYETDIPDEVKLYEKGQKKVWRNENRDKVLYLQINSLYQDYAKYVSTIKDAQLLNETTIKNYFKSKRYFIGQKRGHRFEHKVTSCYVFNYSVMKDAGIVNLDKLAARGEGDVPASLVSDDGLDF